MAQDTWTPSELPVLDWLVERFRQDWETQVSAAEIAAGMGRDVEDVRGALMRLYSETPPLIVPAELAEVTIADRRQPFPVAGVTAAALVATGAWPGSDGSPARLAEALTALADRLPADSPERTKLQKAAAAVGGVGQAALNAAISAVVGTSLT